MSALSQLTYTGVFVAVLANQLCVPVPSIVFLMGAGALSARGDMRASIVVLLAVLACLAADVAWFLFGRRWGSSAIQLLCGFSADPRECSRNSRERFRSYGLPLLCVSKFIPGLDAIMPPLGGAEGASVKGFLLFDAVGSLLWSGVYVGLGYFLTNELNAAISWAQQFGAAFSIAIGVSIGLYFGWRGLALVRMIHRLRLRRVSPRQLAHKLKSDPKVAVLDLLTFEEENETDIEVIPGAFSVEPARVRKSNRITVPDDVEIILYSSSGSDVVNAQAAMALKEAGIDRVWVLEGGLKAWREHGLPLSQCLEAPEVVAERLGVELPPG
jgi:membrane protein DedA with SNARE-associated domain/rhodanese-related sulfurtransferase